MTDACPGYQFCKPTNGSMFHVAIECDMADRKNYFYFEGYVFPRPTPMVPTQKPFRWTPGLAMSYHTIPFWGG